jgi:hypothetical protein
MLTLDAEAMAAYYAVDRRSAEFRTVLHVWRKALVEKLCIELGYGTLVERDSRSMWGGFLRLDETDRNSQRLMDLLDILDVSTEEYLEEEGKR